MKRTEAEAEADARVRRAFAHLCVAAGVLLLAFLLLALPIGLALPPVPHALHIFFAVLAVSGLALLRFLLILLQRDFGSHKS